MMKKTSQSAYQLQGKLAQMRSKNSGSLKHDQKNYKRKKVKVADFKVGNMVRLKSQQVGTVSWSCRF